MAEYEDSINNDLITDSADEQMNEYTKDAVSVITFTIIHTESDLETTSRKSNSFKPDMAHQIFTDETIFGYKYVNINLYYLHNSAKCFLDVKASGITERNTSNIVDIEGSLKPWLPQDYRVAEADFLTDIKEEKHNQIYGEVINTFELEQERKKSYKITLCDTTDPEFQKFHGRFETFIVWFIDGANSIDLDDPRWTLFYVYEESVNRNTKNVHQSPVGFCTIYKFYHYPNQVRPRISQFFVLPTHQRKGIATKMYAAIFDYLRDNAEVVDITVEEPTPVFQGIRDFCDSLSVYNDFERNHIILSNKNQKTILRKFKFCKRQLQRVIDIIDCVKSQQNSQKEYLKCLQSIKSRITDKMEKQTRSKRVCDLERAGIVMAEAVDQKEEIERSCTEYIQSLEWPVNKLKNYLSK